MMQINPAQCRAARALLGWSQARLALASGVALKTVADFERGATTPQSRTLADLRRAFEDAGVAFIPDNGEAGVGLRFAKTDAAHPSSGGRQAATRRTKQ